MNKILFSSCLLGEKVRYDGSSNKIENDIIKKWQDEGRIIKICPEVEGGLPIPRIPAEIIGVNGGTAVLKSTAKVINKNNEDVTENFIKGANIALDLVKKYNIKIAILKSKSPSCGSLEIYDGTFSGNKIKADGVTVALLKKHGVTIFNENQIKEAYNFLL